MKISMQLYSARNFPPLTDNLRKLKDLGYDAAEGFGGQFADPAALKADLDAVGLAMPSAHMGLDQLEKTDEAIAIAKSIGISTLYCPAVGPADRAKGEAFWQELAGRLASIGSALKAEGVDFGWHNHDFEFKPTESGKLPMDIILEGAPEISWECDAAWVMVGGHDPAEWIRKYKDRISGIHLKDRAPEGQNTDEDGWADVGHGTMDWKALIDLTKAETNCRNWVMEHDNPNDFERFASRSIETVRALS